MTASVWMAPVVPVGLILIFWVTTWLDRLVTLPAAEPQRRLPYSSH